MPESVRLLFDPHVRQGRWKAPVDLECAFYHCYNKSVEGRFVFGKREKVKFFGLMREYEAFSDVHVLTFNFMENHIHLVMLVPRAPATPLTDEELLMRVEGLTVMGIKGVRQQLTLFRERGQHDAAEALRNKYLVRMWDVSEFMKSLVERFTQWYNKKHKRQGRLWQSRFKSTLVEGAGDALAAMAAYVDLNRVRIAKVTDPLYDKWCGYSRAVAGDKRLREGLRIVMAGALRVAPETLTETQALELYRMKLFMVGDEEKEGTDEQGRPLKKGTKREDLLAVLKQKGKLPLPALLRLSVRYFVDGQVMGSKAFVNAMFEARRSQFGPKRKTGARRMRGVDSNELYVLRDLRRALFDGEDYPAKPPARAGPSG